MGLLDTEVAKWKRAFGLLGGIPKTFKNNPRNAETMDAVFGFGGIIPGVGDAVSAAEAKYLYDQGDMLGAGLAGLGALPMVPALAGTFIGKKGINNLGLADVLKQAEARLTQSRMNMTPIDRQMFPPWSQKELGGYDVPEAQQIVRFGDGPAMSTSRPRNHLGQEIPKTIYHGSNKKIDYPDFSMAGKSSGITEENKYKAFWATSNKQSAEGFGDVISEFNYAPKKPLIIEYPVSDIINGNFAATKIKGLEQAKNEGYDSVIFRQKSENEFGKLVPDEIAIFSNESISATRPRNHLGQEIPPTPYELAHAEAQRVAALPVEQGGLGLPPDNTYIDRAKAMGHDIDFQHGSNKPHDITAFDIGKTQQSDAGYLGQAIYGSEIGGTAYSDSVIYPLKTQSADMYKHTMDNWNAPDNPYSVVANRFGMNNLPEKKLVSQEYRKEMMGKGYSGVLDTASNDGSIAQVAIYNPSIIRSRFAAFNPAKRDSADLLAGLAPWALPVGATLLGGSFLLPPEEY